MTANWNPNAGRAAPATTRADRTSRLVPLEISSDRLAQTRIVVRNLSPYGIGARGDVELIACERVTVHLPEDHKIGATVRWVRGQTFGLLLDERIEPAQLQVKPGSAPTDFVAKDSNVQFVPVKVNKDYHRPGFVRSHRDQIMDGHSRWNPLSDR